MRAKVGDVVSAIDCHPSRCGVVITTGSTIEDARTLADEVISNVIIETQEV